MNDLDDKPLPLSHLRTPVPLNEFDYAAVRARVHAKLARRSPWPLVFRFASAFAAVVLAVLALIPVDPASAPVGVVRTASVPRFLGSSGLTPENPSMPPRNRETEKPRIATIHHRAKVHRPRPTPAVAAASRIEIHTADPDIRIIWIVPKENS